MGIFALPDLLWSFAWGAGALLLLLLLLVAWAAVRALQWAWWTPRRLERTLRAQGLNGSPYRFLYGDLKELARLNKEERSKPLPLSHDIAPRVFPLYYRALKEHGLVKYEGEKWAKHRRILNPAFHVEKLKRKLPAFSACCSDLVDRWEKFLSSEGCYELDVWPELQNFTGDVISRAAFGVSYEEGRRIYQLQSEQAELFVREALSVYIPGYRFLPTAANNRRKAIDREVCTLIRSIVRNRENALRTGESSKDDLLGFLMEANLKEFREQGNKSAAMTTEDVIEECKLFYFAGQETTSVLLTWTMVVLSMHPNWQERAREEVLQVFGQNKPDFDGLSKLKIVTMILYEVLRLYPPGVQLALPIILIHHDHHFWGKDVSEFKPDRFAEGISKASKDQVAFFPFGGGPRICIGQNFALLEAKMGLSMILQRFSFELSPSYVHAPWTVIGLHPQHGAQLRLHRLRVIVRNDFQSYSSSSLLGVCACVMGNDGKIHM